MVSAGVAGKRTADPSHLAQAVRGGDRRALARAITLVESWLPEHRRQAEALLEALLPGPEGTIRLGISGVPGVGKSTFIERLGLFLVDQGRKCAVLAVDPSSKRGGGSILGDKTRMTELSRRREAFIRPSPTGGTLGGVARRTREAMLLCEAAGFSVILVETVGVGQSETAVADLTDMFLLLLLPAGGDELQGVKRGIVELADLVLVNKADGELAPAAGRTVADYRSALGFLRPVSADWRPEVHPVSSLTGAGIDHAWKAVERHRAAQEASGERRRKREAQARAALWAELGETLLERLGAHPVVARELPRLESRVARGETSPSAAARQLLETFLKP
jgi:LAO/AO transport system kinase